MADHPSSNEDRLMARSKTISWMASVLACLLGVLALAGWALDIPLLKSVLPGFVTMKANTAAAFILSGLALLLLSRPTRTGGKWARLAGQACAGLVSLLGLLTLAEYAFHWDLGIDQLLFDEAAGAVQTTYPGRMAPNTALSFLLLGLTFCLLDLKTRRGFHPAQVLMLGEGLVIILALAGYIHDVTPFYGGIAQFTTMALHTMAGFALMFVGVFLARPDWELTAAFLGGGIAGITARRLLLATFVIPFALDLLALAGQRANLYGADTMNAIRSVLFTCLFALFTWKTIRLLSPMETQLQDANRVLAEQVVERTTALGVSENRYRTLVENALTGVYQTSLEGAILFANQELARILGFDSASELVGTKVMDRYKDPQDRVHLLEILQREKQVRNFEVELLRRDGQPCSVLLSAWREGEALFGMMRDISEQKLAEQRYRSTLDNMLEGVQIIGPDWRYLYLNDIAARHGQREKEELLGHTMMEMYPGIEKTPLFAALECCMKERLVQHLENEFIYPDGSHGWFELSIQPIPEGILILSQEITGRKQAEAETLRRLQHIEALHAIDQAISGSFDLQLTLDLSLQQVIEQMEAEAAAVLLLDPHTQALEYAAGRGFREKTIERSRLRLGEGHAGRAALERIPVSVYDLQSDTAGFARSGLLAGEGFTCYHGVPLITKGQVKGVLEVFLRAHRPVDDEWLNFLQILAGQVAIAVDNASLFEGLTRANLDLVMAYDNTIEGWSLAMDLRDKETEGHTKRVTDLTVGLARRMGMSEEQLVPIRRGALLHDMGKMGVPDAILLKPGKLTDEEWEVMSRHPQFAYDMLSQVRYLRPALDIPYCHHEKWDGSGYPRGLKGEQIPPAARIFAIVDVYDALTSDRPYRQAWTKEKTLEYIQAESGKQFDPQVARAFLEMMGSGE